MWKLNMTSKKYLEIHHMWIEAFANTLKIYTYIK